MLFKILLWRKSKLINTEHQNKSKLRSFGLLEAKFKSQSQQCFEGKWFKEKNVRTTVVMDEIQLVALAKVLQEFRTSPKLKTKLDVFALKRNRLKEDHLKTPIKEKDFNLMPVPSVRANSFG